MKHKRTVNPATARKRRQRDEQRALGRVMVKEKWVHPLDKRHVEQYIDMINTQRDEGTRR